MRHFNQSLIDEYFFLIPCFSYSKTADAFRLSDVSMSPPTDTHPNLIKITFTVIYIHVDI